MLRINAYFVRISMGRKSATFPVHTKMQEKISVKGFFYGLERVKKYVYAGISRDKTMDDIMMYIPNNYKQNYPLNRLEFL